MDMPRTASLASGPSTVPPRELVDDALQAANLQGSGLDTPAEKKAFVEAYAKERGLNQAVSIQYIEDYKLDCAGHWDRVNLRVVITDKAITMLDSLLQEKRIRKPRNIGKLRAVVLASTIEHELSHMRDTFENRRPPERIGEDLALTELKAHATQLLWLDDVKEQWDGATQTQRQARDIIDEHLVFLRREMKRYWDGMGEAKQRELINQYGNRPAVMMARDL